MRHGGASRSHIYIRVHSFSLDLTTCSTPTVSEIAFLYRVSLNYSRSFALRILSMLWFKRRQSPASLRWGLSPLLSTLCTVAHTSPCASFRIIPLAAPPSPPRFRKPPSHPPTVLLPFSERHVDNLLVVVDPYRSFDSPWTVLAFCPRCRHRLGHVSHHHPAHPPIMDPIHPSLLKLLLLDFVDPDDNSDFRNLFAPEAMLLGTTAGACYAHCAAWRS